MRRTRLHLGRHSEFGSAFPAGVCTFRRRPSYMKSGISPSEFAPLEPDRTINLDVPWTISSSLNPSRPQVASLLVCQVVHLQIYLDNLFTSLSDRQTTSQFNQRNDSLKIQPTKSRDVSDLSKKNHSSDQRCRNDTVQDQGMCLDFPSQPLPLTLRIRLDSTNLPK